MISNTSYIEFYKFIGAENEGLNIGTATRTCEKRPKWGYKLVQPNFSSWHVKT